MTIHHANAITQDRTAGNRARWIDCKDRYAAAGRPDMTEERGYERALSSSRWPGDAHYLSLAGQRKEGVKRLQRARVFVLNECRQAWQRPKVRPLNAKEDVAGGYHNGDGRGAFSRM